MTEPDPFIALWQTAPQPDVQATLDAVKRADAAHKRLNWTLAALLSAITLIIAFEEATGRLRTHGVITVLWSLALFAGFLRHRYAARRLSAALSEDTRSLLALMLLRAKRGLRLARTLYLGTPIGAVIGWFIGGAIHINAAGTGWLSQLQTALGLAMLSIMMVSGLALAGLRRRQVDDLTAKLQAWQNEV